jgi:hypothetical protein
MVHDIFPTKIYKTKFPDMGFISHILNDVVPTLEYNGYHPAVQQLKTTFRDLTLDAETFKPFHDFIESEAKTFWDQLGYLPEESPVIKTMVINRGGPGSAVLSHNHYPNIMLAATLYLSATPEQGNLVVENPNDLLLCAQPYASFKDHTRYEVPVHTGDLVIFPAYLKHFTFPNKTDSERVVFVAHLGRP